MEFDLPALIGTVLRPSTMAPLRPRVLRRGLLQYGG